MSTDFLDDDLIMANKMKKETLIDLGKHLSQSVPSSSRMARQKAELTSHVAEAISEIEMLRKKQELLEKEKADMEDLTRKQEEYERGKKDIMGKLERSIILINKEAERANQMIELLAVMRTRFEDTLDELKAISEENWADSNFQIELNSALVLVEDARRLYIKGLAKIDAMNWSKSGLGEGSPVVLKDLPRESGMERGFTFWFKAGLGVTLPLIVVMVILFLVYIFVTSGVGLDLIFSSQ